MLNIATASEQVASYLKNEILQGRWAKTMPGRDRLGKELGVDPSTVERALGHLEDQGVIRSQGNGKPRLITIDVQGDTSKRILIFPYEREDQHGDYLLSELVHRMRAAGHSPSFAAKALVDLKHDPKKVAAVMQTHPHDACILVAGSHAVLEMAANWKKPCLSLSGRTREVKIAGVGPMKANAIRKAVNCLCKHGHKRIVMLSKSETLLDGMSGPQLAFLDELKRNKVPSGDYNLPQWDSTPSGLRQCLESLFKITPPTAIFIDNWKLHYAVQNFLNHQRGAAYRRVACISTDYHPSFKWCDPKISYLHWNSLDLCRLVMAWVGKMAKGKPEIRKRSVPAEFVEGQDLALSK